MGALWLNGAKHLWVSEVFHAWFLGPVKSARSSAVLSLVASALAQNVSARGRPQKTPLDEGKHASKRPLKCFNS